MADCQNDLVTCVTLPAFQICEWKSPLATTTPVFSITHIIPPVCIMTLLSCCDRQRLSQAL